MSRLTVGVISTLLAGWLTLTAEAAELRDYTVADLLEPCQEGDNDARWGANLETTCEQFINGFTGAYILTTAGGESEGICLPPPGNRPDEVRWAFTEWAYENYHRRHMPAAEGLLAAIKAHFPCN